MSDVALAKEFEGQLWVTAEYHVRALDLTRQAMKAAALNDARYVVSLDFDGDVAAIVVTRLVAGSAPAVVAAERVPLNLRELRPRMPEGPTKIVCSTCGANRLREACRKPFDCAFKTYAGGAP